MRTRDVIGLILALILAAGVAYLTRIFLIKQEAPKQTVVVQQTHKIKVLIAAKTLPSGSKIKPGDLTWQEWPEKGLQQTYITDETLKIESLMGTVVRYHITQGEPIIASNLIKPGEKGILAAILSPGKRAISIDVTPASSNSGLIMPGDFVDVIMSTFVAGGGVQQQVKTQTILSNVKVVAIDTDLSPPSEKPKNSPHVATLELTPAQAEILMAGAKEGMLSLSLHSLETTTIGQTQSQVTSSLKQVPKKKTVILMRGMEKNAIEFEER